jgi:virulence-associated protein VagC
MKLSEARVIIVPLVRRIKEMFATRDARLDELQRRVEELEQQLKQQESA